MPRTTSRFPRTSYARRAAGLAQDIHAWRSAYLERARGRDNWVLDDRTVGKLEDRAAELEDLVVELQGVALRIQALR
jgi:hypothetical protein